MSDAMGEKGRTPTDSERLEWMARVGADFCYTTRLHLDGGATDWTDAEDGIGQNPPARTVIEERQVGCRVPHPTAYRWEVFDGPTFRDAIDLAMLVYPGLPAGDCNG